MTENRATCFDVICRTGDVINSYKIVYESPEAKRLFCRVGYNSKDNIKMDSKSMHFEYIAWIYIVSNMFQ